MAYKIVDRQYCAYTDDYRCEFVVDSESDIASLPICSTGSIAIVTDGSGSVYMANTEGEWRKL